MEIVVVLDETGSMAPLREDAIGGFNEFLADQKKQVKDAVLTLIQFSKVDGETHRTIVSCQPVTSVEELTSESYRPRGFTPLWDAVGAAIGAVRERNPDKAIFVILTDGRENASVEYTAEKVKEAVEECKTKGWEFVYLGANQDAWVVGQTFGLSADQGATFSATSKGVRSAYAAAASATQSYSDTGEVDVGWKSEVK